MKDNNTQQEILAEQCYLGMRNRMARFYKGHLEEGKKTKGLMIATVEADMALRNLMLRLMNAELTECVTLYS